MCRVACPDCRERPRATAPTAHRPRRPRCRSRVMMASPRTAVRAKRQRDALERLALKAVAKDVGPGDGEAAIGRLQRRYRHALGGERFHPCAVGAEPRPACAAERQHGGARIDRARCHPASRNDRRRRSSQPVQRWRSANCTPAASSRRSHARSSGEALNACGNTRPLEPTKVGCPSASLHSRKRIRRKRLDRGARDAASLRRSARETAGSASLCVRLSPPRPAIRNLRPADGIAS